MWGDVLLGALEGGINNVKGNLDTNIAAAKDTQTQAIKDKRDFQKEILKGIILQSMKPKSKNFDWEDMLEAQGPDALGGEGFLEMITKGLKGGARRSGGGGGGGSAPSKKAPIFTIGGAARVF